MFLKEEEPIDIEKILSSLGQAPPPNLDDILIYVESQTT